MPDPFLDLYKILIALTEDDLDTLIVVGLPRLAGVPGKTTGVQQRATKLIELARVNPSLLADIRTALRDLFGRDDLPVDAAHALVAPWTIPDSTSHFIGRGDVLDALHGTITARRRAALVGTPGVGKTQTVLKYAGDHRAAYTHGFWINADSTTSLLTGYAEIAARIDPVWKASMQIEEAVAYALEWLSTHDGWLLILDNADDIAVLQPRVLPAPDGREATRPVLPAAGHGHLIVTTRNPSIKTDWKIVDIRKLGREEGATVLLACAGDDAPTDADRAAAGDISEAMEGLPLALNQAGAFIAYTGDSVAAYRDYYLAHKDEALRWQGAHLGPEFRTVHATFQRAVNVLETRGATAAAELLRLSAFLAPDDIPEFCFTQRPDLLPDVLQLVAGQPLRWKETLAAARNLSLIERDVETQSFSIHRLLRDVIRADMDVDTKRDYTKRIAGILAAAFPGGSFEHWGTLDCLLPHQRTCAADAR